MSIPLPKGLCPGCSLIRCLRLGLCRGCTARGDRQATTTREPCPHCRVRVVAAGALGLCKRCWRDKAIRARYKPAAAWKEWTPAEDRLAFSLRASGTSQADIAAALPGRTKAAVRNRLQWLDRMGGEAALAATEEAGPGPKARRSSGINVRRKSVAAVIGPPPGTTETHTRIARHLRFSGPLTLEAVGDALGVGWWRLPDGLAAHPWFDWEGGKLGLSSEGNVALHRADAEGPRPIVIREVG